MSAPTLTPGTKTNLATLATVVICALYLDRRLASAETARERDVIAAESARASDRARTQYEFDKLDLRLRAIEGTVDDRWRKADMQSWARDFADWNPTLKVKVPE